MSNQPKYVLVKTGSGHTAAICRLTDPAHNQFRTEYEQVAHGDTPDMRILFRDLNTLSTADEEQPPADPLDKAAPFRRT